MNEWKSSFCLQVNLISQVKMVKLSLVDATWVKLTVKEKVCQTWGGTTVNICGGDTIGSCAVMQFWSTKKTHYIKLNKANAAQHIPHAYVIAL